MGTLVEDIVVEAVVEDIVVVVVEGRLVEVVVEDIVVVAVEGRLVEDIVEDTIEMVLVDFVNYSRKEGRDQNTEDEPTMCFSSCRRCSRLVHQQSELHASLEEEEEEEGEMMMMVVECLMGSCTSDQY